MHQSSNIKIESTENTDSLLVFKINDTHFCTRTESVLSIAQPQAIYKIPLTPKSIAGITVSQGNPVPVYCLGTYLGEKLNTRRNGGVIIYVKTNRQTIGVWVDETSDIIEVTANEYIDPDDVVKSELIKYCITYNDKILLYLDFEYLNISCGEQNKPTSSPSFSVVEKQSFDTKNENSLFYIKQSNQDFDSPSEQNEGQTASSQSVNENINELTAQKNAIAFTKEESLHIAAENPIGASVELIDRDADSGGNTQTENDSIPNEDGDVPAEKTDKESVVRINDASNDGESSPVVNTKITSAGECFSRQSSSLKSQIYVRKHQSPKRHDHSLASGDKPSFTAENGTGINSIQHTAQDTIQYTAHHTPQLDQSTDSQKEKSYSNALFSMLAFGVFLAILLINMLYENGISEQKQDASIARIKNDTIKGQEKIQISGVHKSESSTNDTSEIYSSARAKNQVDEERPVNNNSAAELSKLHSTTELASTVLVKNLQEPARKSEPTKKPVITVKPIKSALEKPRSDLEGENDKIVIVELSSETLQIVVERFKDHRQQLTQRNKHKHPAAENLRADNKNKEKEIVSQVSDTPVLEPGNIHDIVDTQPKQESSAKDLPNKPNHSNAVVSSRRSTDRPSLSKFEEFRYVVTRGDTLWDIAAKFLGDPFKYKLLSEYSHVRDPNWIYPGDVVIIRKKIQ